MYGRGSIAGVLNPALLEGEHQPGQDILVVLADEYGFTSKASFDSATATRKEPSPQKTTAELGKRRNPFTSSPDASPSKRTKGSPSNREANKRRFEVVDDQCMLIDPRLEPKSADHETGKAPVAG